MNTEPNRERAFINDDDDDKMSFESALVGLLFDPDTDSEFTVNADTGLEYEDTPTDHKCDGCGDTHKDCDEGYLHHWSGTGVYVCHDCYYEHVCEIADWWARENQSEIENLAEEYCEVGEVEIYDPDYHFAPTPEEYAMGDREAYTANSVHTDNRHNCSNYEELLRHLDKDNVVHRHIYWAIRERIGALIEAQTELQLKEETTNAAAE